MKYIKEFYSINDIIDVIKGNLILVEKYKVDEDYDILFDEDFPEMMSKNDIDRIKLFFDSYSYSFNYHLYFKVEKLFNDNKYIHFTIDLDKEFNLGSDSKFLCITILSLPDDYYGFHIVIGIGNNRIHKNYKLDQLSGLLKFLKILFSNT